MIKNYLKIAWRNLVRNRAYSLINTIGLSVGIACCLFILLYIQKELSYDTFHKKADYIYRVSMGDVSDPWAWVTNPTGPALAELFPEVEAMVQVSASGPETLIEQYNRRFYEDRFVYATPSLFEIFDFPVVAGDPSSSLQEPYNLFLSESMVRKYFPGEDPLGKTLDINNEQTYTITGIFRDIPDNSHIRFDFVASRQSQYASGLARDDWSRGGAYTYVLLNKNADPAVFQAKLDSFKSKFLQDSSGVEKEEYIPKTLLATPLREIHLYSDFRLEMIPQGDIVYVYIFGAIALLILVIASINYMSLATARATRRAREVGIRKVSGAHRGQLVKQYLSESYLLVLIALIFSILLVELFLPGVNNLMQRSMKISWSDPGLFVFLLGLWLLTGLGAGGYPALYLSGFQPTGILKGIKTFHSKSWLRKVLVTFQLTISIVLIISTIIIQRQMQLARESQPGFDREQVVMIPTRDKVGNRYGTLRSRLLKQRGVQSVTTTSFEPGEPGAIIFFDDNKVEGYAGSENIIMDGISVGSDFIETFGLSVTRGRSFSGERPTDQDRAVMVNEEAVRYLGWEEPIGKTISYAGKREVIGVVKDFHYKSIKEEIKPVIIVPVQGASRFIAVKLAGRSISAGMDAIQSVWNEVIPEMPLSYSFLDDSFDTLYQTENRLNTLITFFSVLAIVIACLGLVGLSAYMAEQRTKEIGIRKVMGASVRQIVSLLTRDFMKWMAAGLIIAIPVAHYAMGEWLQNFEYKVDMGIEVYLVAGSIISVLILVAVSWQSVRAALANPVESLRSE